MTTATQGVIRADESYNLPTFKQVTGLKDAAIRIARANGLIVRQCGVRRFILGRDWLAYLDGQR